MRKKIVVISGRYGCDLETPELAKSVEDAEAKIRNIIADLVYTDHGDKLQEAGIGYDDVDEIIRWGSERDLCTDHMYMGRSDWTEYQITELELPEE